MKIYKRFSIILFSVLFILANSYVQAQDKIIDQIVAVVGSNIILKSDIESMALQKQAQGETTEGDLKCEILEELLIQKLMVAEAQLDTTIEVTDNQVNQQIEHKINYFLQYLGSEEAIEQYFKKPFATIKSQLEDVTRDEIYSQQMNSKIIENVKATPSEVRYYYRNLKEEEKPLIKERYEYAQIIFTPKITEYEKRRIKSELRDIRKKIENGSSFATMAMLYSEDGSKQRGGELGFMGRAELDKSYANAAFKLKPGQMSNVVESEFGYHLIQMIEKKGERINTRHIIIKPQVDPNDIQKAADKLDSVTMAIRKEEISFKEAAMRYSMDKDTRNNGGLAINPYTMSSKFEAEMLNPDVSKVITNLKIGEISDPFSYLNEKQQMVVCVVKLIDKTEQHRANIREDFPELNNMYLAQKEKDVVEKWVAERQSKTYIRIDETFMNCDFKYKKWLK